MVYGAPMATGPCRRRTYLRRSGTVLAWLVVYEGAHVMWYGAWLRRKTQRG
ncbi:hypothetical protein F383_10235 [Gossypium arboreum]|uniref:Uncharacterized protein n=1 Tax=Gossypium arboreum TaxID=29729 RepID=A0A0B0PJ85_GOSAR|nr:hypothetical protein F383_00096 [Gossypium arboreum]KHG26528.1 hypothetical protein F383_10235 [Gossypium arboreum]